MRRHEERGTAVLGAIAEGGLDALLVSDRANVRYLTGYAGTNGLAVLAQSGRRLLTDSRYAAAAREQVRAADVVIGERDLLDDATRVIAELAPRGRVGVEADALTLSRHERLREALEGVELVPVRGLVEEPRRRKSPEEVQAVREAAAMADAALAEVLSQGLVGRTERDVAFAVRAAQHAAGAEDQSFPTIVAAGPRGALPHATPGDEPIEEGTLVVIDQGVIHAGYCSDLTRTVPTGPLPEDLEEIYAVCLRAQEAALAAVRPGLGLAEVDAVARGVIAEAGLGDAFGHGLGHGVGLQIHEAPRVAPGAAGALETGMIVTIEPGVYLEGRGGVRHEDLVVVTEDGCEILSASPKAEEGP